MDSEVIPPLPEGFKLDEIPPLPPGFSLDSGVALNPQLRNLQYKKTTTPELQIDPVMAGSIGGGLLGMAFPPAGSMALGGLVGTALGTSIGTSAKQIMENLAGAGKTAREKLTEQLQNVSRESGTQLGGQLVGSAIVKGAGSMVPVLRQGAESAQQLLGKYGGALTPSQMGQSTVTEIAESFARAGAGGKGAFLSLDKRNADALQAIKDNLIKKISNAPVDDLEAGRLFQDAIKQGEQAHQIASNGLYQDFDSRVGNAIVDSTPIKQFGLQVRDALSRIGNVGKSETGGRLIDQLSNLPDKMTFSDAQTLRSNLLAQVRDLEKSGVESKALGTAKMAAKLTDNAMETSAKALPQDLQGEFRQINAFYKSGKQAFNNDVIKDLVNQQPERVGEKLFQSGNVSEISTVKDTLDFANRIKRSIDNEDIYKRLQGGYLNALLTSKAATNIEGETVAQNLMKTLADAKTNRQFQVMFTEDQRNAIQDFGRTAYLALRNKPSSFGILAPLLQAAAIGDLALGASGSQVSTQSPAKDIGVLVSPYVLAQIMTNPKATRVLAMALRSGVEAGTPALLKYSELLKNAMGTRQE